MFKIFSIIIFFFFSCSSLRAQFISGQVVDQTNHAPLAGASIITASDTLATDTQGAFSFQGALPLTIRITHMGYEQKELSLTKSSTIIGLEASATQLNAVIITAGASQQIVCATPVSIGLVNQQLLRRDAPFTTTSAINRIPGVLLQSGALNTNRLTIRGIGSRTLYGTNKIKAYFEEIPLTDGSGNSTIEDVDQNFIDRIEVIKGPNSSIYGAGLGGVVRLFAHRAEPLQTAFNVSQTIGSFGRALFSIQADHHDGKNQVSLGFTNLLSQGYRQNSDYNRKQAGMSARTVLSPKTSIATLAQYTWLKAYIPSSINEEDYLKEPQKAAFTWNQTKGYEQYNKGLMGISLNHGFNNTMELKISVFGQYRDAYEPRPFNILEENTNTIGTRAIFTKEWNQLSIHLGTELFQDNYQWKTFENNYTADSNGSVEGAHLTENKETRTYQNVFAESAYAINDNLTLSTGLNFNHTAYDLYNAYDANLADISGAYTFDPVLSPKLSMNYQKDLFSIFGNISHGFSPPSLEETLYPDGQVNPNIEPESGWNYEVGYRGRKNRIQYDLVAYYMDIRNLLVAQRTAEDAYVGVNAGVNNHWGIDALMNYTLPLTPAHQLNTFFSGAWMHYEFGDFTNDGISFDGNQLTGVPQYILNAGLELISRKGFYGNVNGRYLSKTPLDDANSLYAKRYFLLNARVGYLLQVKQFDFDTYLGVNNLGDTRYASMLLINATGFNGAAPRYYYPGDPRNVYAGIRVKYRFLYSATN